MNVFCKHAVLLICCRDLVLQYNCELDSVLQFIRFYYIFSFERYFITVINYLVIIIMKKSYFEFYMCLVFLYRYTSRTTF